MVFVIRMPTSSIITGSRGTDCILSWSDVSVLTILLIERPCMVTGFLSSTYHILFSFNLLDLDDMRAGGYVVNAG
jgi:hypothetical protein